MLLLFQVELKPGYYLEARPHAYTEDDKPVYTRTGKVAKKVILLLPQNHLEIKPCFLVKNPYIYSYI